MKVVVTTAAISRAKLHQIITTNKPTPNFLQAGCPSCRPTNSVKAQKRNRHTYKSPAWLYNFTGRVNKMTKCTNSRMPTCRQHFPCLYQLPYPSHSLSLSNSLPPTHTANADGQHTNCSCCIVTQKVHKLHIIRQFLCDATHNDTYPLLKPAADIQMVNVPHQFFCPCLNTTFTLTSVP